MKTGNGSYEATGARSGERIQGGVAESLEGAYMLPRAFLHDEKDGVSVGFVRVVDGEGRVTLQLEPLGSM